MLENHGPQCISFDVTPCRTGKGMQPWLAVVASSKLFASMSGTASVHSYHLPFHLRLFHKEQAWFPRKCIVLALVLGSTC